MNRIQNSKALLFAGAIGTVLFAATASFSFAATDTTPPSTPTGLAATPVSLSQINLSWTASTDNVGVTGYGIFRDGLQVGTTAATSYSDTGLSAGTNYTYAVDAFDAAGNLSTQSSTVSTSTLSDTTAPSVPTGLTATAVSSSQVNLSWSASSDNVGVTGYDIYRNGVQVATTAATSYSDIGLSASMGYTYTVAAFDAEDNVSAQSGSVSATTLASSSTDTTPPSVPPGLSASAVSSSQINLTWTASTDNVGVTGYKVYRNGTQIGTTAGTSYSDTGLSVSTTYSYTVAAYDAAGNTSAQSGSVSATTLASGTAPVSTYTVPPTVDIGSNGSILLHGMTVTSVGTNTFTGTVWGLTYTVDYTSSTASGGGNRFQFLLRNGTSAALNASQIEVGDQVGVQGTITQSSPTVIQAQIVRNYSVTTPRPSSQNSNHGNGNGQSGQNSGNGGIGNLGNIQTLLQQLLGRFNVLKTQSGQGR